MSDGAMTPEPQTGKLTYELGDVRLTIEATATEGRRVHEAILAALGELTRPAFVLLTPSAEEIGRRLR